MSHSQKSQVFQHLKNKMGMAALSIELVEHPKHNSLLMSSPALVAPLLEISQELQLKIFIDKKRINILNDNFSTLFKYIHLFLFLISHIFLYV